MNFLLPHIRRIPEKLVRDQFAADAAQKLGIDSAVLREELRQAALKRRDHIEVRASALTEVERVLLRALAITDPEHEEARRIAADAVIRQPQWFEGLAYSRRCRRWRRGGRRPDGGGGGSGQRALLAEALLGRHEPPAETVGGAIVSLQKRRDRGRIAGFAGTDRRRRSGGATLPGWRF